MFIGEYHHNIDEKGRIAIPSKYRELLGTNFIITRGIEHCIYVYPESTFKSIVTKLESLPFTKKDARAFTRFFMSGAASIELDKQGRMNIPTPLKSYANLTKNCVIIGTGDRLEIWDENSFNEFISSCNDEMSDIAESLFEERVWNINQYY